MKEKKFIKLQKKIYDGKLKDYKPIYHNEKVFKSYFFSQINKAKNYKILGFSLKSIKNLKMIDALNFNKGKSVLDAGCGAGILLNQLYHIYNIKGYGVDISSTAINSGKKFGNKKIILKTGKLEKLPFKNNFFDFVISFDVLEHIEDKKSVLNEIKRVLKPGGKILLYAISKRDFFTWHWILRLLTFNKFGIDKEGGHFREYFVEPFETKKFLKSNGFKNVKLKFFHSFFTLIMDEILFKIQKKKQLNNAENVNLKTGKKVMPIIIYKIMNFILIVLEFFEIPWKIFGLSNGFFIIAEKER